MVTMVRFPSAVHVERPAVLSSFVREWTKESLEGKYGKEIRSNANVSMDDVCGFEQMEPFDKYDAVIEKIVRECPVRIVEGELLSGSATLFAALSAKVPAKYRNEFIFGASNHTTYNFNKVLQKGLDSYQDEIDERMRIGVTDYEARVLKSISNTIKCIKIWHTRYLDRMKEHIEGAKDDKTRDYYKELYDNLLPVPFARPESFRQALQSLWFTFAFTRLTGNFPAIGRIDSILEPFLIRDIENGVLTQNDARELIAHFFVKGCEWITLDRGGSGDGMYFQNIVLAGVDENGKETAGLATRLILEVVEELPIGDYPIAVRISRNSPEWLYTKAAEVCRHGVGVVAFYNEDTVIKALNDFGYSIEEARKFANDGCWEIQIPGKTLFGYCPMDAMPALQRYALELHEKDKPNKGYTGYDELYAKVIEGIERQIDTFNALADEWCGNLQNTELLCSVASLFVDGCIENARDYHHRGPVYANLSPHMGGLQDVANNLYAIKRMVYEEKKVTLDSLITMLKNNWEGYHEIQKYAKKYYRYYGNDNDQVDSILADLVRRYTEYALKTRERNGVLRAPGISSFCRQVVEWKEQRYASACGFSKEETLSNNLTPAPCTDYEGPTAVIQSYCKCDFTRLPGGTALELELDPGSMKGEEGVKAIVGLLKGFVSLGGCFMHINVVDVSVLEDAQKHPEKYPNLTVRISGWSSRFVTVDPYWQQMIIDRAKTGI